MIAQDEFIVLFAPLWWCDDEVLYSPEAPFNNFFFKVLHLNAFQYNTLFSFTWFACL